MDERLRELRRSDDLADQVRYLAERLRLGLVPRFHCPGCVARTWRQPQRPRCAICGDTRDGSAWHRVDFAAFLGHVPSRVLRASCSCGCSRPYGSEVVHGEILRLGNEVRHIPKRAWALKPERDHADTMSHEKWLRVLYGRWSSPEYHVRILVALLEKALEINTRWAREHRGHGMPRHIMDNANAAQVVVQLGRGWLGLKGTSHLGREVTRSAAENLHDSAGAPLFQRYVSRAIAYQDHDPLRTFREALEVVVDMARGRLIWSPEERHVKPIEVLRKELLPVVLPEGGP